jgi:hypothetical protein
MFVKKNIIIIFFKYLFLTLIKIIFSKAADVRIFYRAGKFLSSQWHSKFRVKKRSVKFECHSDGRNFQAAGKVFPVLLLLVWVRLETVRVQMVMIVISSWRSMRIDWQSRCHSIICQILVVIDRWIWCITTHLTCWPLTRVLESTLQASPARWRLCQWRTNVCESCADRYMGGTRPLIDRSGLALQGLQVARQLVISLSPLLRFITNHAQFTHHLT